MCSYRRVTNFYVQCGHGVPKPDEEIKCGAKNCIFSPNHPPTCQGRACKEKCFQHHQFPQQYSPHKEGKCPTCA
ncbi:hypothetical protein BXZ70DRAFT_1009765 [Cristinia sonorae]|uniref:Uncharacterized protein n=1 Tax=Cristinia sonorae TaxID=1940300 RepID=A0A8K0XN11_9AGAR|nr:hypothetical protein BXZ70DRAFT_1009765 [Cristinia sonorae]